jgi:SAM-dependent methyltransferase
MSERALISQKAREFCDNLWQRDDFWDFEISEYERARCARLLAFLYGHCYPHALEISCGAGSCTRILARIADQFVAFDIVPAAIARAHTLGADLKTVAFRFLNAGYRLEAEEILRGTKNGVDFEILLSLFIRLSQQVTTSLATRSIVLRLPPVWLSEA